MERHTESVSARVSKGTAREIQRGVDNTDKSQSEIVRELLQYGFTGKGLEDNLRTLLLCNVDAVRKIFDCFQSIEEDNSEAPEHVVSFFKDTLKDSFEQFQKLKLTGIEELDPDEKRAVLSVKEGIATDEEFEIFLDVAERELEYDREDE
jgi:hypothetical protein